jgi:phosphotransferase system HPr (HPr) family protein
LEPKSLIQIISEEEFLQMVQVPVKEFFRVYNTFSAKIKKNPHASRKFYSTLIQQAEFLEVFLDDHGARENRQWFFFAEGVASIRNLGIASFYIRHLLDRYPFYNLRETEESKSRFITAAIETLEFLNKGIIDIYHELIKTGQKLGLVLPDENASLEGFAEVESNKRLPRNISDDEVKNEEERIIELCERIKKVADTMRQVKIVSTDDHEKLKAMVPWLIDEKKARMYKNSVHSVQSDFDTYVKNTILEHENPDLKDLRGYISMPLHLLEFVLWLCHFYERHEDEIRHNESRKRISGLVDKNKLLDRIINFGFYYSLYFLKGGSQLAEEILQQFVKVEQKELPIPTPLGFHARPSTYLSLICRNYSEDLFLIIDEEKFNAKSVMSMLQAGGLLADKGYKTVVFEGSKRVLEDVKILAQHNYCEEDDIPAKLSYLRSMNNSG